jgi:hypothetical protein
MALTLEQIKTYHDKAFQSNQITRERAADDMVFYFVTQWDDQILEESQLAYRGEFNILKKAGRQIISDLASNPVQVDFEPKDETRDDAAELIDGIYRTDDNNNLSIEAYTNAKQESVVCGVGGWLLYTEYVTVRGGNKNQVIRRQPLFEMNNNGFWDPGAKLLDKSDADYFSYLFSYTEDGYKKLVKELTGEEIETISVESFKHPEHSYLFPWIGGEGKKIYVVKFFHRRKVKEKVFTMVDMFDQTLEVRESELTDVEDDLIDSGYEIDEEKTKTIERWEVTEYIASGERILSSKVIAGQNIPIVPIYGEHAYVEGEEHYEGVTRLAKDPQRLRNFQLSYLADIVSQSPREKPIFMQEQIAGFEDYYSLSGAENNYAYLLQNRYDGVGKELPIGPINTLPAPNIPPALAAAIDLSRQAVEDVANPGIPQDIADPDLSGKAVLALQNRLDMQSMVYQEHYKHGKRRDADIYASMAAEIYDVPRRVKATLPDGTVKDMQVMDTVYDEEKDELVTIHDLYNAEFEIYSKISASYSSQKEQTIDRLGEMRVSVAQTDPATAKILMLKELELMDGVNFDDIREYANNQLVLMGIKQPDTPEEEQLLADAQQQGSEPDAAMVLAMAEDKKGQAQLLEQQRKGIDMQLQAQNEEMKRQIDAFEAQTQRMGVQVDAEEAGAKIDNTRVDTFGKQIDNAGKVVQLQLKEMSDDQLFDQIMAG